MSAQTLVAMDWDGEGLGPERVLTFLGDALLVHEETITPHYESGRPIVTHRFVFDPRRVRNTEAHGVAFRAGFVSHIE